jgi:hypothetical protein
VTEIVNPFPGQMLAKVDFAKAPNADGYKELPELGTPLDEANLVTSLIAGDKGDRGLQRHHVLLDVDLPVKLLPSSTEGHYHLFIELPEPLGTEEYGALLDILSDCGVIEPGYASASAARGYTAVRLPHVKKPATTGPLTEMAEKAEDAA